MVSSSIALLSIAGAAKIRAVAKSYTTIEAAGREVKLSNPEKVYFPVAGHTKVDLSEGLGDAPWPPHFRKQAGEPRRVQPSRAKKG